MDQLLLAVDGFDGLGKTTLSNAVVRRLNTEGISARVIGRGLHDSSEAIAQLTLRIKEMDVKSATISPSDNTNIRLERLRLRLALAQRSDEEVIVFDRWVHSDLSRLPQYTDQIADFENVNNEAAILAVSLVGSFALAWERISLREHSALSPAERQGPELMRYYFEQFEDVRTLLKLNQLELDGQDSVERNTQVVRDRVLRSFPEPNHY